MQNNILRMIIVVSAFLVPSLPLGATLLNDADSAHKNGDFKAAARLYSILAEKGSAPAQVNLAAMYRLGQGVPQNFSKSFRLCRAASLQNFYDGHYCLGVLYEKGLGVRPNIKEAIKSYQRGTYYLSAKSAWNLAVIYAKGIGVKVDNARFYTYLQLADLLNHPTRSENIKMALKKVPSKLSKEALKKSDEYTRAWKAEFEKLGGCIYDLSNGLRRIQIPCKDSKR